MRHPTLAPRRRLTLALALVLSITTAAATLALPAPPAQAHLATWGSWEVTRKNLDVLFPEATNYLRKKHSFTAAEVTEIEKTLGFKLYPEDHNPEFYVAVREKDGKQELLGVALFIDPRVQPRIEGGEVITLEVGIGVDTSGRIKEVAVYDYKGNPALAGKAFLGQLKGRTNTGNFKIGTVGSAIRPVDGEIGESQLIANAAFEALYLMKVALGKR